MKSSELYARLEKDFIGKELSDDWAQHMHAVDGFLASNFKKRSMGLVCDNTSIVNRVFTAVFPTNEVMNYVLKSGAKNSMLFVHHPSIWDITKAPNVFQNMDLKLLERFRQNNISIFNLHVPLDNFGEYSTSVTLANALGLTDLKPFAPYFGAQAGVIGSTDCKSVAQLSKLFEKAVGHKVGIYSYGPKSISDCKVAVVAGGGNDLEILREVKEKGVSTFVTGITVLNDHSRSAHDFARQNKINILGGTHYSTEKFACMRMCEYFRKLGLEAEFIEGKPGLEDL